MPSWAVRIRVLALAGVIGLSGTACSGGSGSAATRPRPVVNDGIPDQDLDAALAIVEREFIGCRSLGIDIMGGSTVVRPGTAEEMLRGAARRGRTGRAVRETHTPVVVVLRDLDMFLVELGPSGRRRPLPFDQRADALLREARTAGDGCGATAAARYS